MLLVAKPSNYLRLQALKQHQQATAVQFAYLHLLPPKIAKVLCVMTASGLSRATWVYTDSNHTTYQAYQSLLPVTSAAANSGTYQYDVCTLAWPIEIQLALLQWTGGSTASSCGHGTAQGNTMHVPLRTLRNHMA